MYTDGALGGAVDTDLAVGSNQSIVKEKRYVARGFDSIHSCENVPQGYGEKLRGARYSVKYGIPERAFYRCSIGTGERFALP